MLRTATIGLALSWSTLAGAQDVSEIPAPTHVNVAYGPHERNVLDFWQADAASSTPLVLYFHGGSFIRGSKESLVRPRFGRGSTISNIEVLQSLLDAGISVAAVGYRLMPDAPLPASFFDAKRALQFLRSKSGEWNIDKARVGAFGDSAGAQISMWLAFKDEMSDPDSIDPVARESSRLTAVASRGGQTVLDEERWLEWIPRLSEAPPELANMLFESDDLVVRQKIIEDLSALTHLSADDPPIYLSYEMRPDDPIPTERTLNWQIHHVIFGIKLKERADELGLSTNLTYPGAASPFSSVAEFFKATLVHAETPVEVTLIDELDEPRAGYCLDTRGGQNQDKVVALQSHSCRSYQGQLDADQKFDADKISEGTFELFELGLCMTARTPTVDSELTFEPCTGDSVQKFAFSASGAITPVAAPEHCLTVVEGPVRPAGRVTPRHRARDITLQPCDAERASRQLWQLRGAPE